MPKSVATGLSKLPKFGVWAKLCMEQESVLFLWDEKVVLEEMGRKIQSLKGAAK